MSNSSRDIVKNKALDRSPDRVFFSVTAYVFVALFALVCLAPFILMVSGSFSTQTYILRYGYTFWPRTFTTIAYDALLGDPIIMLNSFFVSVFVTFSGTALMILVCSLAAYALGRKEFKPRNKIAFIYFFTTLFHAGLVPYYFVMINYYGMRNNILALILPGVTSVWSIIMLRNFMKNNIPDSLIESAKIDGAGELTVYARIAMPLMVPSLMAIGFFAAIGYWNDWFSAMLFMDRSDLWPLQYQLFRMLNQINALAQIAANAPNLEIPRMDLPGETVKLAMAVIAAAPIIFLFGFIQKYFVKGITIGAVKG